MLVSPNPWHQQTLDRLAEVEKIARDLLARLSHDYGDSEDFPPEVRALFDRGEKLLPIVGADDIVARTRLTPPTPIAEDDDDWFLKTPQID